MVTLEKAVKSQELSDFLLADLINGPNQFKPYIKTFDIVIIGGGPSGTYLGYSLAKQGIQPIIFDHSHPREKPCSGTLSSRALRKFPILEAAPLQNNIGKTFRLISPEGQVLNLGKEFADRSKAISRRGLDRYLLDAAIRLGCRFIPEKVISLSQESGLWKIRTAQRELRARIVVGADGTNSIVRKAVLSPHKRQDLAVGIGYLATGFASKLTVKKFYKNRQGHLWVSDRGNHCCIGISDSVSNASTLKEDLDQFLKAECPDLKTFAKWSGLRPQANSPDFFKRPCSGRNWLLTGDAAGHVHPLTGEGILYALWSAELASLAITTGDLRLYDFLWKEEYGKELIDAVSRKQHYYNLNNIENAFHFAQHSPTLSEIIYNVIEGEERIISAGRKIFLNSPKILFESVFNDL